MGDLWLYLQLLVLLGVANSAPIAAKHLFGQRLTAPLDFGCRFVDGRPLLGPAKTFRGLLAAIAATTLAAGLLGLPLHLGAVAGAMAMLGDALSSFVKRRLGVESSGRATGLDQLPEALLPLLAVRDPLGLSWLEIIALSMVFFVVALPVARLAYRLGLRDRPH